VTALEISRVRFRSASAHERRQGVIGHLTFLLGGALRVRGVAVLRTPSGLTLEWPVRVDSAGRTHRLVRPVDDAARRALEARLLGELGLGEAAP